MNFFEKVTSLVRSAGSLEDLGLGLARALDQGSLLGFVFYGAPERCFVTTPYRDPEATTRLRDRFEKGGWRVRPREAFLEIFSELQIPTGEIGEAIRLSFLGPEEDPLGAFAAVRDPAAPSLTEAERRMTDFFFNIAGDLAFSAVRSRKRDRDAEERDFVLQALNQVGRLMIKRPDRARLLPALLKIALDVARTEVGSILLERDGRFATEVEWGLPAELFERIRILPEEERVEERIRRTLEPIIVDDLTGPTVLLPAGFPKRISSLIAVPLLAGERLVGILNAAMGEEGRELLSSTLAALNTIAGLIATAVENARLGEAVAARAREANQGLAEEQGLLRQVMGSLREGVLVSDSAGRIVIANRTAEEMLGLGGAASKRFPERNVVTLRPFFQWLRERWAASWQEEEYEHALAVNPPAVLSVRIFPLNLGTDRFRRLTTIRDVTQERRSPESLSWAARVAQELEPPLACVQAALALQGSRGGAGAPGDLASRLLERNLGRLLALAEDLRDRSLLESGGIRLQRSLFHLEEVVAPALLGCRAEIEEKEIACRGPTPLGGDPMSADRALLEKALRRILAAAVSWTAEKGWMRIDLASKREGIEVRLEFLLGPGSQGFEDLFAAEAEGGCSLEELPAAGATRSIGLVVARRFLEAHGGSIRARSEKDIEGSLVVEVPAGGPPPEEEKDVSEEADGIGDEIAFAGA